MRWSLWRWFPWVLLFCFLSLIILPKTMQAESYLPTITQELNQITIDFNLLLNQHKSTLSEALTESKDLTKQLQSLRTKIQDLEKQLQDSQMTYEAASKLVADLKTQLLELASKLKDSEKQSIDFLKDSEVYKNNSTLRIQRLEKERDLAELKASLTGPVIIIALLEAGYIASHFLGWGQ